MQNLVRSLLFAVAVSFSTAACEPKVDPVDETQKQMREANASLARMDDLENELRPSGVNFRTATYNTHNVALKSRAELQVLEAKLTEYVTHGSSALRISNRLDVAYADRAGLASRLQNAKTLLAEVQRRLREDPRTASDFWTEFLSCSLSRRQNLELHGIRILQFDVAKDGVKLFALTRDQRREVAARARRYMACEKTLADGRAATRSGDTSVQKTNEATDPTETSKPELQSIGRLLDLLTDD